MPVAAMPFLSDRDLHQLRCSQSESFRNDPVVGLALESRIAAGNKRRDTIDELNEAIDEEAFEDNRGADKSGMGGGFPDTCNRVWRPVNPFSCDGLGEVVSAFNHDILMKFAEELALDYSVSSGAGHQQSLTLTKYRLNHYAESFLTRLEAAIQPWSRHLHIGHQLGLLSIAKVLLPEKDFHSELALVISQTILSAQSKLGDQIQIPGVDSLEFFSALANIANSQIRGPAGLLVRQSPRWLGQTCYNYSPSLLDQLWILLGFPDLLQGFRSAPDGFTSLTNFFQRFPVVFEIGMRALLNYMRALRASKPQSNHKWDYDFVVQVHCRSSMRWRQSSERHVKAIQSQIEMGKPEAVQTLLTLWQSYTDFCDDVWGDVRARWERWESQPIEEWERRHGF